MGLSQENKDSIVAICIWVFLGLVGGFVKNCEEFKNVTWRRMLSSMITSAFAGAVGGMILSGYIEDRTVLGGICAMFGYMGQLTLVLFVKMAKKRLGIDK